MQHTFPRTPQLGVGVGVRVGIGVRVGVGALQKYVPLSMFVQVHVFGEQHGMPKFEAPHSIFTPTQLGTGVDVGAPQVLQQ